ncbi:hypothetical protein EAG_02617 [Camponotus floridanus]|uniref:Uncharacterized protein n=1 Tax=Camponotus floridanus TaxID=104421 RepID=E2AYC9_CAMFO|nr:hypothetical protein EAG_02617 [Camponotus floridanus]
MELECESTHSPLLTYPTRCCTNRKHVMLVAEQTLPQECTKFAKFTNAKFVSAKYTLYIFGKKALRVTYVPLHETRAWLHLHVSHVHLRREIFYCAKLTWSEFYAEVEKKRVNARAKTCICQYPPDHYSVRPSSSKLGQTALNSPCIAEQKITNTKVMMVRGKKNVSGLSMLYTSVKLVGNLRNVTVACYINRTVT